MTISHILFDIRKEVERAESKHAPMNSAHEGYAVLLEEVEELKAEVFKGGREPRNWYAMRAEAIETAAMAVRLIKDVIEPKIEETGILEEKEEHLQIFRRIICADFVSVIDRAVDELQRRGYEVKRGDIPGLWLVDGRELTTNQVISYYQELS